MGTRSVEVNQGKRPTIAHVPTGIVHGLPRAEGNFEKVPANIGLFGCNFLPPKKLENGYSRTIDGDISLSERDLPLIAGSERDHHPQQNSQERAQQG
jgi:hypothetical protein